MIADSNYDDDSPTGTSADNAVVSKIQSYWDGHYSAVEGSTLSSEPFPEEEWIVRPSNRNAMDALARAIVSYGRAKSEAASGATVSVRLLEVGCGRSRLSAGLLRRLREDGAGAGVEYTAVATDVSAGAVGGGWGDVGDGVRYGVLDVLRPEWSAFPAHGDFDVVLDKGCLDTFLFRGGGRRTRRKGAGRASDDDAPFLYSSLVRTMLDNVSALTAGCNPGMTQPNPLYLVLTPRKKIRELRDYLGFVQAPSIQALDGTDGGPAATLVGRPHPPDDDGRVPTQASRRRPPGSAHLHVCELAPFRGRAVRRFAVGVGAPDILGPSFVCRAPTLSVHSAGATVSADGPCPGCHLHAAELRRRRGVEQPALRGRGEGYWKRAWRAHVVHCR